jgi:hypothetical protein
LDFFGQDKIGRGHSADSIQGKNDSKRRVSDKNIRGAAFDGSRQSVANIAINEMQ